MLLALDLATETGIAFGVAGGKPTGRTERLGEPGAPHGQRFAAAMRLATNLILEINPDYLVIEEPIAGGVKGSADRSKVLMGLRGAVFGIAHVRRTRVLEFSVASCRKHFIGHAGLPSAKAKAMTVDRCNRLGWNPANHNEADAMAVWDLARASLLGLATLPPGLFDHEQLPNEQPGTGTSERH